MTRPSFPEGGRRLPRVAYGDPAEGARAVADMIPAIIAKAEAMGADEVAGHLRMALLAAERRAAERQPPSNGEGPHASAADATGHGEFDP